jgi:hypothetical protein
LVVDVAATDGSAEAPTATIATATTAGTERLT